MHARQYHAKLQTDEHEREYVQHEDGHFPNCVGRDPVARVHAPWRPPRNRHRIAHHRDDCGQAEPVREYPHRKRAHELEQHRNRNVVHTGCEPHVRPSQQDSGDDAPAAGQQKHGHDAPARDGAGHRGCDGHSKDQQRACVVEETLALEDHQYAMRRPQSLQYSRRSRSIRGRDDCPQGYRRGPANIGYELPHDECDCTNSERNHDECEAHDRR